MIVPSKTAPSMSSRTRLRSAAARSLLAPCVLGLSWLASACSDDADLSSVDGAAASDEDWVMAGHDAEASFHNSAERQLGPRAGARLEVAWSFDTARAGIPVGPVHATPVVVNDRVFVGDMFGQFFAIDPSGALAWSSLTLPATPVQQALGFGSPVSGVVEIIRSPILGAAVISRSHGLVVFGDTSGSLYALHLDTGESVWTLPYVDAHPLGGVVGNSLVLIDEDTVVVAFSSLENLALVVDGVIPEGYPCCSHTGLVMALDVQTGDELWRYETLPRSGVQPLPETFAPMTLGPSGADIWGQPSYDVRTDTLFIGTGQNFSPAPDGSTPASDAIIALDASTGAEKWRTQITTGDIWVTNIPNPNNGKFLDQDFGDSPKLYRYQGRPVVGAGQKSGAYHVLDRETGELLRSTQHLQQANSLGGFQNGGGYADARVFQHGLHGFDSSGAGEFEGVVLALSESGEDVLWRFARPLSPLLGNLAIADGVVYVVSTVDETPPAAPVSALYALDAASGEVLFRREHAGRAISSPVVSRGRVYLSFGNSVLEEYVGLDLAGGIECLVPATDLRPDAAPGGQERPSATVK